MKQPRFIAVAILMLATACSGLTPEDRRLVNESYTMSQQAAQDARIARAEAAKASEKADRIWQRSQQK